MKIRHNAANFNCCAEKATNCSRMWDAIETENKAIKILGKPGRQIKTVIAENSVARAAQERAQMPLGRKKE